MSASQISDGPVGLGTRFHTEVKGIGWGEVETITYDAPNLVEFLGNYSMGESRHLFSLTAEGERTSVDQVLEMGLRGIRRLLAPVMAIMMRSGARRNAAGLERHFQDGT